VLRLKALPTRSFFAALVALLLGVRLLSPAGFMPSFEHGAVAIVACPNAGPPVSHHDHHRPKNEQPCPYAAATALGTLGEVDAVLLAPVLPGLGWAVPFNAQRPWRANRLRPPATGPPILT
jgi:hypothetical protein